jgi:RNA polymerase sigma-70 factor (ECF subfamily)
MAQFTHTPSDEELIKSFQEGRIEAFNILVGRYKNPLVNFVFRYLGDLDQADDVVQETFIKVYQNKDLYRPIAKFSTWIYTIATNLAKTQLRNRNKRSIFSLHRGKRDEAEGDFEIRDDRYPADRLAESSLAQDIIQRALAALPEQYREAVILSDIQELSYDEICAITGMNMGTLKSRLNRGRSQLQVLLKDLVHE